MKPMFGAQNSVIDRLRTVVDDVVATDPATLGESVLAAELIGLRAEIDRLEAGFAQRAWTGHQRGIGLTDASPSTAAWLRRRTGMRDGDARTAITHGEGAEILTGTGTAWRNGEISRGAARTIIDARVPGHDTRLRACEHVLLDLARHGNDRELRRAADHFRTLALAEGTEPREHDGLTISPTTGATTIRAELSGGAAETVVTAIHALTDPPTPDDDRSPQRRRADALVRMAELALSTLPEHRDRARTRASIVIDWATLTASTLGRLDGEFTGGIHPHEIDKILCDSTVSRVITGPDGIPIDVGRARRTVPAATRRAVVVRDGGCRFPGCDRPPGWCDAHHVIHWSTGGRTDINNLVLLCDHHHEAVHRRGWTVKFDGHELRIIDPHGSEIT